MRKLTPIIIWPESREDKIEYLAGLVYGDGYIERARIEIYDSSIEFLNQVRVKVLAAITEVTSSRIEERKKYNCYRLRAYGKTLASLIRETIQRKRRNVSIPFTQGLFDAEGSIWRNPNIVAEITIADKNVLENVQKLLNKHGIRSRIHKDRTTHKLRITTMSRFLSLIGLRHPKHISKIK